MIMHVLVVEIGQILKFNGGLSKNRALSELIIVMDRVM